MVFTGTQILGTVGTGITTPQAQPFTMSTVAIRTGNTSAFGDVLGASVAGLQFLFANAANQFALYAGGAVTTAPATDNVFHAIQGVYSGASSSLYIDGSSTTPLSPGAAALSGSIAIGDNNNPLTGKVTEVGIWAVAFNGTQQSNMNSNQHTYWGF
jgi:hypothetical protein